MHDLPDDDDWLTEWLRGVGRRVEAERVRQNLTQEALYLAARVDRRTLQNLEAGSANPTLGTLSRIAYVLGVPVSHLVQ